MTEQRDRITEIAERLVADYHEGKGAKRTFADLETSFGRIIRRELKEWREALLHATQRTHVHSPKGCDGCNLAEKALEGWDGRA